MPEITDNLVLFASSLVSLSNYGYILKDVNLDLANSEIPNVLTEYEAKFVAKGIKINYLVAEKD
jgi:tRNA (guanine-N7-)-methyltransferase